MTNTTTLDEILDREKSTVDLGKMLHSSLALIEELCERTYPNVRTDLLVAADAVVRTLALRRDRADYEAMARTLCSVLYAGQRPPHEFWATDLGADVAWAIGHPFAWASRSETRAVLQCSRAQVWELFKAGMLVEHGREGYTSWSIRSTVREWPYWPHRR